MSCALRTAEPQGSAPGASGAATTTSSPASHVTKAPASTQTGPVSKTLSGVVTWNHRPQGGVTVEVSELGAPGRGHALASATAAADGTFTVRFISRTARTPVGAFVPAHGPCIEGGRPASNEGDAQSVGSVELARAITGLSVRNGDVYKRGPLTLSWDAVPEASAYCVNVWPSRRGASGGSCPSFVRAAGELVTTTSYRTPPLDPERYAVSVIAITDVVIGTLDIRWPGLTFTVERR